MANGTDQAYGRPGRSATNHSHLQGTLQTRQDIWFPAPAQDDGGLSPAKSEQGHRHDANTPVERKIDLVAPDAKVGDQRDEAAEEVAHTDDEGADERARRIRFGRLVMETHEEVEHHGVVVGRVLEWLENRRQGLGGQFVGSEYFRYEGWSLVGGLLD